MYFNDARRREREGAAGDQRLNGPANNYKRRCGRPRNIEAL